MQPETQKNTYTHTHSIGRKRRGRKVRKEQGKNGGGGRTRKGEMTGENQGLANRPSTELQSPARIESCKEARGDEGAAKVGD